MRWFVKFSEEGKIDLVNSGMSDDPVDCQLGDQCVALSLTGCVL